MACFFTLHPLCPHPHLPSSSSSPCKSLLTQASPFPCTKHALRKTGHGFSSSSLDGKRVGSKSVKTCGSAAQTVHKSSDGKKTKKDGKSPLEGKGKKWKRCSNNGKNETVDAKIRYQFEMCSKAGDVMGAISLYDSATEQGLKLGQYHYTMVLYLCSSAALGVVRPAKSGSESRSLQIMAPSEDEDDEEDEEEEDGKQKRVEILVSETEKKYALERGYQVYETMRSEGIPMNEASLTSVARMAMARGDGDKAFDMVKEMADSGISPRLRSYGPALSVFCSQREVEKAFQVERHMLDHGVQPEEVELEALLRVCVGARKPDKVYYLLHKLRAAVRSVSAATADVIQEWFESAEASRVGRRKWDRKAVVEAMEGGGGGWHGLGWLGGGKWSVSRSIVGDDGSCRCCGQKLALIDLDPKETDKFAESVAAIASKREKNSSFQKFQKWLDYYGPFEAIVDAANVGLYSNKTFKVSKVKAVVNGIRQMLASRKWPLIVLHNRRISGPRMDEPMNCAIIERWKTGDALYATPTGSNDDWYWLYAAIKYKCLLVTNDEMRDHIFQLLGNDFFPRWKERHQVRFSFSEVGPVFHMPPPCSVVIQESERGDWHIPIASEHQSEGERPWLCIRRTQAGRATKQDRLGTSTGFEEQDNDDQHAHSSSETEDGREGEQRPAATQARKTYGRNKVVGESANPSCWSTLAELESAEERSGSVIDFQI